MNHEKLKLLIEKKAIYLCNAKNLSDGYETVLTEKDRNKLINKLVKNKCFESNKEADHELEKIYQKKKSSFINCWTINREESYALWKIYLSGEKNGIAIKSTVAKLKKSITDKNKVCYISQVNYSALPNVNKLSEQTIIITKKPFYKFESELRIFIIDNLTSEDGVSINCDINTLIQEVYISPFSDDSYT